MRGRRGAVLALTVASCAQLVTLTGGPAGAQVGIGEAIEPTGAVTAVTGTAASGVEGAAVLGYPTEGSSYGWLATGSNSTLLGNPGDFASDPDAAKSDGLLQLTLAVPAEAQCLSFDFTFMTEEYPEWVGSRFNDVFVAQLGAPDVTLVPSATAGGSPTVTAPGNFALDEQGNQLTVNSAYGMSSIAGVQMDGATPMLSAFTPVVGGSTQTLSLTLKDVSDAIYDSAVFFDNLRFLTGPCEAGSSRADAFPYGRNADIVPAVAKFLCNGDGTVEISGSGFAHNAELKVYIYSTPTLIGTLDSTAEGTFTTNVRIPKLEAGNHKLVVEDAYGNSSEYSCKCLNSDTTKPAAASPTTAASSGSNTGAQVAGNQQGISSGNTSTASTASAVTGRSIGAPLMFGLVALLAGIAALSTGRSRRREL